MADSPSGLPAALPINLIICLTNGVQAISLAAISDRIMARSQCRASEAARRSSSTLAINGSLRPSARMIL
jgi:hypothetical protein